MQVPYQLVWRSCSEDPSLAERFFVPGFTGSLPFFVEGDGAPGTLDEEQLLKGLVTALPERDSAGRLRLVGQDQATLLQLLEIMRQGFSFESTEELCFETAGNLRARHGVRPSCAALSSGILLAPTSARIRADLILDLWACAETSEQPELQAAQLAAIGPLFETLDASKIPASTHEACAYHALAAAHLTSRFDEPGSLEQFLVERVIEVVAHPQLKAKVKAITDAEQAGERLPLAELHVE